MHKAGTLRAEHVALRRGTRTTVVLEDYFWVYKVTYEDDEVYVAINRDNAEARGRRPAGFVDGLGNCSGGDGSGPDVVHLRPPLSAHEGLLARKITASGWPRCFWKFGSALTISSSTIGSTMSSRTRPACFTART